MESGVARTGRQHYLSSTAKAKKIYLITGPCSGAGEAGEGFVVVWFILGQPNGELLLNTPNPLRETNDA